MAIAVPALRDVDLDSKYTLESGRIFVTGPQALVRLLLLQRQRDQLAGLNTAGFVSGYRGSPLGALDLSLWKAEKFLDRAHIKFQPGLNEDLAATSIWGSQQVTMYRGAKVDGVFAMWYGKGPGVDRCGDVFKHANMAGTSKHGGVLVLAGDDHAAKSSTMPHQSDHQFSAAMMPVLYPSSVQEIVDLGLHGFAMSRYSGCWVGFKCVSDTVESSASIDVDPTRVPIIIPDDFPLPPDGIHIRWPDPFIATEARMQDYKVYAALHYCRVNRLNRIVIDSPKPRLGIIASGKSYLDVRQALDDLGITEADCAEIGIRLFKVAMTWPLEPEGVRHFAEGLNEILVVEEKRQIVEYQLKEQLYNWRDDVRPRVVGKFDEKGEWMRPHGDWLLPPHVELTPAMVARVIAQRIERLELHPRTMDRIRARVQFINQKEAALAKPKIALARLPYFCSGCPHNTSTKVPEGSRATAGIGCHVMAIWMDRATSTYTHMGAEGVPWIGQAPFTDEKHMFANLGDGTYYHSGSLAIRAAVAAKVNITYKILYNDAVAMTGGQPVDGPISPQEIARQCAAEGVSKIVVVTDEPDKYPPNYFASDITVYHRDELNRVQLELRDTPGTTILLYDQTCAAEKRRRRKRGTYPDPAKRVVINELVCEGCGDCGVKSNCVSVAPVETEFGRKRTIDQSSCNKDYSCVNGFCPSFVTVEGGKLRKPQKAAAVDFSTLPEPALPSIQEPYGILVTGIGGTGVVTIGALLGMAAHLENKGVSVLDMTGLAQKNGAVVSHIRIANTPDELYATRIAAGEAKLILACDILTGVGQEALGKMQKGVTKALVNTSLVMPAQFTRDGAGDQGRGRAGRRRVPGRHAHRDRPDGRFDRNQPVHGRLRVSARTAAGGRSGHSARDRIERRGDRIEQAVLPLGPPRRGRSRTGGRRRDSTGIAAGFAAAVANARRSDRAARHVPDRLPGRRVRGTLPESRDARAQGRRRASAGRDGSDRSGGAVLLQAARDQGRVRGRATLRGNGFRGAREGAVRGRLHAQVPSGTADAQQAGREEQRAEEVGVRTMDDVGVPRAREAPPCAWRSVRHLWSHRRAQA